MKLLFNDSRCIREVLTSDSEDANYLKIVALDFLDHTFLEQRSRLLAMYGTKLEDTAKAFWK